MACAKRVDRMPIGRFAAFVLVSFSLIAALLSLTGCSSNAESSASLPDTGQQEEVQAEPEVVESPELKVSVSASSVSGLSSVQVTVTGKTESGAAVNDMRTLLVGQTNTLGYPAGTYEVACAAFTAPDGKTLFKESKVTCDYAGNVAQTFLLVLQTDTAEMQRIAAEEEAARVAAEQEAARAAAEAQAAAEAAAAEEAAQARAQAQAAQEAEYTVYITKTGEKYHSNGCQYLSKSKIAISESKAIAQGYTPCSRCNP